MQSSSSISSSSPPSISSSAQKLTFKSLMPTTPKGKAAARAFALATILFATWYVDRRRRKKKLQSQPHDGGMKIGQDSAHIDLTPKFGDGQQKRDVVEQASWESFPASDPPAY